MGPMEYGYTSARREDPIGFGGSGRFMRAPEDDDLVAASRGAELRRSGTW
jgi:hypothetical protein